MNEVSVNDILLMILHDTLFGTGKTCFLVAYKYIFLGRDT